MRARSASLAVHAFLILVCASATLGQERSIDGPAAFPVERRLDGEPSTPPVPPLPFADTMLRSPRETVGTPLPAVTPLNVPGSPDTDTVVLPLPAGVSIVSLPFRTRSEILSEIFPDLPEGSQVWVWNAADQRFVAGFHNVLSPGQACMLYVPLPALAIVSGTPNRLQRVSVDIERGWNLVGVPYRMQLPLDFQHVYVDWARKPFRNAVSAGELGSRIYSLDENGYTVVAANGSLAPLRGYWVWASGAEILELSNPSLAAVPALAWTILGKVGDAAFTSLLTQMGIGDQATLNTIVASLDSIAQAQNQMYGALIKDISTSKIEILGRVGYTTYVVPVENALSAHSDKPVLNDSLAWFAAQAQAQPPVSMDIKTRFADRVINEWQFNALLLKIRDGINPASGKGLLDDFADQVVNSAGDYDLQSRYSAMETYFNTLMGMQVKCAVLIMTAYNQLGNDPAYPARASYPPGSAADWKRTVFDPVIKEEMAAFLRAAESIAVRRLPVPEQWTDAPAVTLPDDVQVMLGMADLFVMETLRQIDPVLEPAGVRVRIMVNPGGDAPPIEWNAKSDWHRAPSRFATLPAFESVARERAFEPDKWRSVQGDKAYANWRIETSRAFDVTREWKVVRTILTDAPGTFVVLPRGEARVWGRTQSSAVQTIQSPSNVVFGSVTFAARPSTREVFDPCGSWPVPTYQVTDSGICLGSDPSWVRRNPCDVVSFHACLNGGADMTLQYDFTYKGTSPTTGTWKARGGGLLPGLPDPGTFRDDSCGWPFQSSARYRLLKAGTEACSDCSTLMRSSAYVWSPVDGWVWGLLPAEQNVQVTWEPGQTYTFQVVQGSFTGVAAGNCVSSWTYSGVETVFP